MASTPGARLKAQRLRMGYTQQGVADHISQSIDTYRDWERDKAKPRTYATAAKLCRFLHMTMDHYICGAKNTVLQPEQVALLERYRMASKGIQQAVDLILKESSRH